MPKFFGSDGGHLGYDAVYIDVSEESTTSIFIIALHSATSQKTAFVTLVTVKASDLAILIIFVSGEFQL